MLKANILLLTSTACTDDAVWGHHALTRSLCTPIKRAKRAAIFFLKKREIKVSVHTNQVEQRRKMGCDSVWRGCCVVLREEMSFQPTARHETCGHGAPTASSHPIHFPNLSGWTEDLLWIMGGCFCVLATWASHWNLTGAVVWRQTVFEIKFGGITKSSFVVSLMHQLFYFISERRTAVNEKTFMNTYKPACTHTHTHTHTHLFIHLHPLQCVCVCVWVCVCVCLTEKGRAD